MLSEVRMIPSGYTTEIQRGVFSLDWVPFGLLPTSIAQKSCWKIIFKLENCFLKEKKSCTSLTG